MLGSSLLDVIPVKAMQKQKISQTATKAEYISDYLESYCRILKIQGLKFGTLCRRIVLPSSCLLASVKSTKRERKNWHRKLANLDL